MDRFAHARDVVIKPLWLVIFALWTFAGFLQQARDGLNNFAQIKLGVKNLMGWLPDFSCSTWLLIALAISLTSVFEGSFRLSQQLRQDIADRQAQIDRLQSIRPCLECEVTSMLSRPEFNGNSDQWTFLAIVRIRNSGTMASAIAQEDWRVSLGGGIDSPKLWLHDMPEGTQIDSPGGLEPLKREDALYRAMRTALGIGDVRYGYLMTVVSKASLPDRQKGKLIFSFKDVKDIPYSFEAYLDSNVSAAKGFFSPFN